MSQVVGRSETVDELLETFDAVFLGVGAGLPVFLKIPGEHFIGVYSANEYLTRANLMKAYDFPNYDTPHRPGQKRRHLRRRQRRHGLGPHRSPHGCRPLLHHLPPFPCRAPRPVRPKFTMPRKKGVEFLLLSNPLRFLGSDDGFLIGVECLKMELGEPDASGRRRPVPVPGSEFIVDIDTAVISIGSGANPLLTQSTPGLSLNKWGYIVADPNTGKTMKPKVWAGGDIVTGSATVILAMGAGRLASNSIHDYLTYGW